MVFLLILTEKRNISLQEEITPTLHFAFLGLFITFVPVLNLSNFSNSVPE